MSSQQRRLAVLAATAVALLNKDASAQLMPDGTLAPLALDPADVCGDIGEIFAKVAAVDAVCCPPDATGDAACDGVQNTGTGPPEVCSLDCGAALAPRGGGSPAPLQS